MQSTNEICIYAFNDITLQRQEDLKPIEGMILLERRGWCSISQTQTISPYCVFHRYCKSLIITLSMSTVIRQVILGSTIAAINYLLMIYLAICIHVAGDITTSGSYTINASVSRYFKDSYRHNLMRASFSQNRKQTL